MKILNSLVEGVVILALAIGFVVIGLVILDSVYDDTIVCKGPDSDVVPCIRVFD